VKDLKAAILSMAMHLVMVVGGIAAIPQMSFAIECGDLDGDCKVSASDALRLLRRAVGLNQSLLCECNGDSVCESAPPAQSIVENCFGDAGCLDPAKPYCDGHVCSECSQDSHCGEGSSCDHALYRCMRNCIYD
jgi:Cys-rich repeat protein